MDLGSARMATSARGALAHLWAGCCVSGLRVRGVCLYSVLGSFGSGFERFAFGRQHMTDIVCRRQTHDHKIDWQTDRGYRGEP